MMNILNHKVMRPMKKAVFITLMTVLLVSCDDFGNINEDPNNPSQVRTELLLTSAQRSIDDVIGAVTGTLWIQYFAETQYTDAQEYRNPNASFNGWYTGALQDLQTIINLNSDEETRDDVLSGGSNANQLAAARVMRVYFFQMITDRWGMVPYSEALLGRDNFQPSYDAQEAIYTDMINELKEAVGQMDGGAGVNGDILFSGNMGQWAQFANSLRARVALRLSEVNPSLAATEFADAVNSGLIEADVMYPYLADADNENPWYNRYRTRTDYAIHETIADYMKNLEDYRITMYANPAPDADNGDDVVSLDEIVGMPFMENAGDLPNSAISFPGFAVGAGGPNVGQQDAPLPIVTLAEMNFAMAEAVERGWISGSAEDYYTAGIEASWNQWGVYNEGDFSNFISKPEVAYDSGQWKMKIGTQKWVALFPQGYEAWAEWRRLDYPELESNPFASSAYPEIPLRFTYPTTEVSINEDNYNAAVDMQGPDSPYTKLWWDVN